MVQFKAAYLSLGGRLLAGGSSLPLGPWITCLNIRHAYPSFTDEKFPIWTIWIFPFYSCNLSIYVNNIEKDTGTHHIRKETFFKYPKAKCLVMKFGYKV